MTDIIEIPLSDLRPNPNNARTHGKKQIRKLADAIRRFGFRVPILVDDNFTIICGHGRVEAARLLGIGQVPAVVLHGMSPAEIRAFAIADNRLAELARWDDQILARELGELVELDFEVELTGFDIGEIDVIIEQSDDDDVDAIDLQPTPVPPTSPVTQAGDVWILGEHRLVCGNALEAESYAALLNEERVQMCFTDPPYNLKINGHVSGKGQVQHREFAMATGEMSEATFAAFLTTSLGHAARVSMDGAVHMVCMDWRHLGELKAAADAIYSQQLNLVVWRKTNAGMGSLYRSQHELVGIYKVGKAAHRNNVQLGRYGRNRSNVWTYAGANSFGKSRLKDLADHPTVKPVRLVMDAIRDVTDPGGLVLDPFGGSGSTLLAAEKTGRRARLIELDPSYCDVIVTRWEAMTKQKARLLGTNETMADVGRRRTAETEEVA